ncbi:hypothetical protein [Brevundimonas sp.]
MVLKRGREFAAASTAASIALRRWARSR